MNKTGKTAVVSIYPGIGDIIWHLPFFRALAEKSEKKKIYLFTRQTTLAKDILEYEGIVSEILPNAMFKVKLENDHEILAHTAGRMRKHRIRILAGDKVIVEMSTYDLTKGRIIFRHK